MLIYNDVLCYHQSFNTSLCTNITIMASDPDTKEPFKKVCVEGNIGSGKTTFLQIIGERLSDVTPVPEPVDIWRETKSQDPGGENILQCFYSDPVRFGYTFQNYAFLTRLQRIQEYDDGKKHLIIERSIESDRRVFAETCVENKQMTSLEFELYNKWATWLSKELDATPKAFIYLRCDPTISYNRLKKRDRVEESSVPLEYLVQLHQKHDDWLLKNFTRPTLVIDASVDFANDDVVMQDIATTVKSFIDSLSIDSSF